MFITELTIFISSLLIPSGTFLQYSSKPFGVIFHDRPNFFPKLQFFCPNSITSFDILVIVISAHFSIFVFDHFSTVDPGSDLLDLVELLHRLNQVFLTIT